MNKEYTKRKPSEFAHALTGSLSAYDRHVAEVEAFNALPLEERKAQIIKKRKENVKTVAKDIARVSAVLVAPAVTIHEVTGAPWHYNPNKGQPAPVENSGAHDGSTKSAHEFASSTGQRVNLPTLEYGNK